MPKPHKIKRYRQYGGGTSFRAKPHPVAIVMGVVALAALVLVGVLIFPPIYELITKDPVADISDLDIQPEPSSTDDAQSAPESQAEPKPEPPRKAGELRAVYMPTATALDTAARDAFLASLDGSDITAVMVDIKDANGNVLFNSTNPSAIEWGAVSATPYDLAALVSELDERGLSLVARMSVFRDALAAKAEHANAITYRNTETPWLDNALERGGKRWLNPYAAGTREYILALAGEAADAGAVMIVLNDFQFPPGSGIDATFGTGSAGISRSQILQDFLADMTASLSEKGARVSPYVTAVSLTQESEYGTLYGGSPLATGAKGYVLGALPYQFGGDFNWAGLVVERPTQNPGGAVGSILGYAAGLLPAETDTAALVPLIQGGNEPSANADTPYTRAQIDAQITALRDRGINEYILYSTTGEYLLQ